MSHAMTHLSYLQIWRHGSASVCVTHMQTHFMLSKKAHLWRAILNILVGEGHDP